MGVELVEGRGYEPYEARRYKEPTLMGQLLYHCLVKLVGNNTVYVGDAVKCYVQDENCSMVYRPMPIEKLRTNFKYRGYETEPIDEILVTVNEAPNITRTIKIPRNSKGNSTEIKNIKQTFSEVIKLFTVKEENVQEEILASEPL